MDIFVGNVASNASHQELRLFLRDTFKRFDILAFEVFKKLGNKWAIITAASFDNAQRFLQSYGGLVPLTKLTFRSETLSFKRGNKQPDVLKVRVLADKEADMRAKALKNGTKLSPSHASQPILSFSAFEVGTWVYDNDTVLTFNSKFKDQREGTVTFGRSALVIYLAAITQPGYHSHCRIDIPYAIIEHAIPSHTGSKGTIHLTLKSPPKIYRIENTNNIHLYSGKASDSIDDVLSALAGFTIRSPSKTKSLHRLCSLADEKSITAALCLVYRLVTPDVASCQRAWSNISQLSGHSKGQLWSIIPQMVTNPIEEDFNEMDKHMSQWSASQNSAFTFGVRFQLLALVYEGTVTPTMMTRLIPFVSSCCKAFGAELVTLAVRRLGEQIPTPGPLIKGEELSYKTLVELVRENAEDLLTQKKTTDDLNFKKIQRDHLVWTYKATITPTGILLRGPDLNVSNRVLRRYSSNCSYFMRVFFADEDGMSVLHDARADQEPVYSRFREILYDGLNLAGRKYSFLGFSNSSLRYHAAWFMAPFLDNDRLVTAKDVIKELGDFLHIQCSAKCAARIGQAFTDTIHAITIPTDAYVTESKADVKRHGRCFSDGCGTISLELLRVIWKRLPPERRRLMPTILQIRYRGAKGVISLDSTLPGQQLYIRQSMTKYPAAETWRDIEICGAAYRPLRLYLNHQFIKILEDLGVPQNSFLAVQNDAMRELELNCMHPLNAASFLEATKSAVAAKVPRLVKFLHEIGISFQADRFLTDVFEVALMSSLRDLKYRARIPVQGGHLLYGIMDETGELKEGEVYITILSRDEFDHQRREILIGDRVVVTRAPALHPGDIQVVKAVDVSQSSPLRDVYNCIVFSQHGTRDLPSQLGGGDLDGDQFHIIYDERLIPPKTVIPSTYANAPAKDLGRPVEVTDMADFFIEYMKADVLGQVSNRHKIRADIRKEGTMHTDCITLAELASEAVDFSKSGNAVDMRRAPLGRDQNRPDFMAPAPGFVMSSDGTPELVELEIDDVDDPDSINILDPEKSAVRYYKSQKILGVLYRNVDESGFVTYMRNNFRAFQDEWGGESLLQKLERYVDRETRLIQWEHYSGFAEELREYYGDNMFEIMETMRPHRGECLTELEVFSGNILGKKERASTRYIREANREVQERFDRDVSAIVRRIISGDGDNDQETEALPRSIACFKVALGTEGWEEYQMLKSWRYVAAAVCLEQLWKYMDFKLRPL